MKSAEALIGTKAWPEVALERGGRGGGADSETEKAKIKKDIWASKRDSRQPCYLRITLFRVRTGSHHLGRDYIFVVLSPSVLFLTHPPACGLNDRRISSIRKPTFIMFCFIYSVRTSRYSDKCRNVSV